MAQTQPKYDRTAEDVGNIVGLEHVNLRVPNQEPASDFYLAGLGLTRDPYMMPGTNNMWVNVGKSQFQLPKGGAEPAARPCRARGAEPGGSVRTPRHGEAPPRGQQIRLPAA